MYRVDDNPPSRFPEDRVLEADQGAWMVAHLRSRREKLFAKELAEKGFGYYLPLFMKRTIRRDNRKPRKSVCPLFPGYIAFVRTDDSFKFTAGNKSVANILKVVDQAGFVRQLSQIKRILDSDMSFRVHAKLVPGDKVRVKAGSLKGIEGTVIKPDREMRLFVGIEMFGQSISVAIGEEEVERV